MRAAIYVRISKDTAQDGAGVRRQETECRALAERLGFTVTEVFSDNDISAYSGKRRPGYEAMLSAIESGSVDVVLCWHTDRLYRRMADLERFMTICQPRSVPTYSVQAGPLDLTTPSGRMIARQLAAVGQYEAEQKGERQRSANRARAMQGRHFSTRRCFGYEPDGLTIRETEAKAIREAFALILNGGALNEVARRWNAAGLPTPQKGNRWTGPVVSRTLRTARLAGMREYRRQIVRDAETGEPVTGEWPAIVDRETWQAVQDVFSAPDRQRYPSAPRQLLSGLAVCGVNGCGAAMQSGGTRNGRRRYRCSSKDGHAYREAAPIDEYVESVIVARLCRADARDIFVPADRSEDVAAIRAELADLDARHAELGAAFAEGAVTLAQLKAANARFDQQRAALETRLPAPPNPAVRTILDADDPAEAWDTLDQDAKRSVIDVLAVVRVLNGGGTKEAAYTDWRKRIVNPATIAIDWR